jgi:hypothetical protein
MAIHTAFTSGSGALPVFNTKKDTDIWVPILLLDKTDGITGETGIAYGAVDVDYHITSSASLTSYSVASADWIETGEGMYGLRIGASEFTAVGRYIVRVGDTSPAAGKYVFAVEVTGVDVDDLSASTTALADGGVFSAKISTDTWVPVVLVDKTDGITGETGVAYGSIDVDYALASATSFTSYTVASADWKEVGEGAYALRIGGGEFSSVGRYIIRIVTSDATVARKVFCAVETSTVTTDDLTRATTPGNTLDIDSNGLVDVSKFNGTAAVVDGTTNLLRVDVGGISSDAAAANTLETIIEGSTQLTVDATKISGDSAAADALELFVETLSSGKLQAGSFANDSIAAAAIATDAITNDALASTAVNEIVDQVWDEAASGHTTGGSFGAQCGTDIDAILADTGTDGVKIDLAQSLSAEDFAALTVGRSLYLMLAHFSHKWTTGGGSSVIFKSDNTTAYLTRTITSSTEIQKGSS